MTDERQLAIIRSEVSTLEIQANDVRVTTADEFAKASEIKARLKEIGKQIKSRKEEITDPLNAALKSARKLFAPIEDAYDKAEGILATKLLAYKNAVDAERVRKEAEIAAKVESGKMKLETAEKRLDKIETVENTTQTEHGKVQFRKIKKVRIVNHDLVPRMYFLPDMVAIRRDALGSREVAPIDIPGVEVYEEETV